MPNLNLRDEDDPRRLLTVQELIEMLQLLDAARESVVVVRVPTQTAALRITGISQKFNAISLITDFEE